MDLVNGGYLHYAVMKNFCKILLIWNCLKNIGYGPIQNSGELSRAILTSFVFF